MGNCWFCYKDADRVEYHPACAKRFFGTEQVPSVELNDALLQEMASRTINERIAVTGVQPKLSVTLEKVRKGEKNQNIRLAIVGLWGEYILKPQHRLFASMPETEDLTMHIAVLFGIPVCDHCLLRASDGSLVYIARRFDRKKGKKIHQEDLCQVAGFPTANKYKSSYEKAGKLVRQYCTNAGLDALGYFELVLFSFLCGNNDMHLKNFTLMHLEEGIALSPAYDLLNVQLINPRDMEELGMTLNGKKRKIKLTDLRVLAKALQIPEKAMENVFKKFSVKNAQVNDLIRASFLSDDLKDQYLKIWTDRQRIFTRDTGINDSYSVLD
ncbi:HipA domain-containing protein [Sediminibacterium soli]|uniref:HipA domain-containing protein n=1 Tax=Sediminibacterium soli TaxID=2698829 RepID=UPI00137AEC6E|nr:HipA domain-containing protein [Sediminibacterium soli]NCI45600.1 HipA domain-containing protein [Sediminibacterium soli]